MEKENKEISSEQKIECSVCGHEEKEGSNFCTSCGTKLHEFCKCWLKKGDIYNCKESKCPGYDLFMMEKLKSK